MRRRVRLLVVVALAATAWVVLWAPPATAQAEQERLFGELEEDDEPIEGVRIRVADGAGEIATAVTGDDGGWEVELPGPGTYVVTLDRGSLPDGVELRDPDRQQLEVEVRPGQSRRLVFPLGVDTRATGGIATRVLELLIEGVRFGLVIAMAAIGLSLVYGTTGLVNFAHGEYVTAGAMVAFLFNASPVGPVLHLVPAAVLAIVAGAALAGGLELTVWRPLRQRRVSLITVLVVSIGLSLFLRHVMLFAFGGRPKPYRDYAVQRGVDLGPLVLAPKDLWVIGLSTTVLVAVGLGLLYTRIGKAMRAVADDRDLAAASGIDVPRVIMFVWLLGGALAALGGVLVGVSETIDSDLGFRLLLLIFAGVIVGGLGSAFGALVGGLTVGIITTLGTLVIPAEMKAGFALGVLVLVLLVRPQGILGRSARVV